MSDPNSDLYDLLEEYVDGLLPETDCLRVEAALARDAGLREEMARVRRFDRLLERFRRQEIETAHERGIESVLSQVGVERRRGLLVRWLPLAAAASLALATALFWMTREDPAPPVERVADAAVEPVWANAVEDSWTEFGRRLGRIALERREGRVPRLGLSDLEEPPAEASGMVFRAALAELGTQLDPAVAARVDDLVAYHFLSLEDAGSSVDGEAQRARAALTLYRQLWRTAGRATADAYYDVFRPALPNPRRTRRVSPEAMPVVLNRELERERSERYQELYARTVGELEGRYGRAKLELVLERMAPRDARTFRQDATERGIRPHAVLSIRARILDVARRAGADRLYVAVN